jgi:hypothetical protein
MGILDFIRNLYQPVNLTEEANKINKDLSRTFGYKEPLPDIQLTRMPKFLFYVVDPVRRMVNKAVLEVRGAYDSLRNVVYLGIDTAKNKTDRIGTLYHEMIHHYLNRFHLPREVQEGYASWLTKRLTGYAKDSYGGVRDTFGRVYQRLGNKIFDPNYREEVIDEFYSHGDKYGLEPAYA